MKTMFSQASLSHSMNAKPHAMLNHIHFTPMLAKSHVWYTTCILKHIYSNIIFTCIINNTLLWLTKHCLFSISTFPFNFPNLIANWSHWLYHKGESLFYPILIPRVLTVCFLMLFFLPIKNYHSPFCFWRKLYW